ncbi:MAG TPA: amino acid adenylation domain-containing protein [Pseudonocardia sp.]
MAAGTDRAVDLRFVPELVAARAASTPDAVAVRDGAVAISYRELDRWADRLGRRLVAAGLRPGDLVGVAAARGAGWVAALLGTWRAGAGYLPLDPEHPPARVADLLADVAPRTVLATAEGAATLPAGTAWLLVEPPGPIPAGIDPAADVALPEPATLPDLLPAYVLHTSGSTGAPKGVLTTRRGVRNYLAWGVWHYPRLRGTSLLHSPVTTDVTVLTLFGALVAGGTLHVGSAVEALRTGRPGSAPVADFVNLTPSHLRLGDALPGALVPRGELVVGGEQLTGDTLARWRAEHPDVPVTNEYGPTETVVGCLAYRVERGVELPAGPLPVGRPIWNTRVHVLDAALQPVAPGTVGELYVSGDGLAHGYLDRTAETASRFVADPFGAPGERMYRTGDLAWRAEDGELTCLGRADDQLQVNGFRVEPGEIEAALREHPGVAAAAVVRQDGALVGYVVGAVVGAADLTELADHLRQRLPAHLLPELADHLRQRLPAHLLPTRLMSIAEIPLTGNGKLDVAALPPVRDPAAASAGEPADDTERLLCELAAEVLCLDEVSPEESLFALGGDSMTVIRLVSRARESGLRFTPRDVFRLRTPARIAAAGTRPDPEAGPLADGAHRAALGEVPLTPIMHWVLGRGGRIDRLSQSVTLRTPADAGRERLIAVLQAVLDVHDMLRAALRTEPGPVLRVPAPGTVSAGDVLHRVDAEGLDERTLDEVADEHRERAVDRLDPAAGAMLRAVWLDAGERPGRLVLVVHHLAVDGVSWGVLLDDLSSAWSQVSGGHPPSLPTPGTAFRTWAEALRRRARDPALLAELPAWQRVVAGGEPPLARRDVRPDVDTRGTGRSLAGALAADRTAPLLAAVPAAYRAGTQDVLLAGLALAVTEWWRRRDRPSDGLVLLDVERHGRDGDVVPGTDVTRTVGWFTALYPVRLNLAGIDPAAALDGGDATVAAVRAVRDQLRDTPGDGVGHGLLRYLNEETADALSGRTEPRIGFNYVGRAATIGRGEFAVVQNGRGADAYPDAPFAHPLEINARVTDGTDGPELSVLWEWPDGVLDRAEVVELAELWFRALEVIEASAPEAGRPR